MFFNLYSNIWIGLDLALKTWLTFLNSEVTDYHPETQLEWAKSKDKMWGSYDLHQGVPGGGNGLHDPKTSDFPHHSHSYVS